MLGQNIFAEKKLKPLLFVLVPTSTTETPRTTIIHASNATDDSVATLETVQTTAQGTVSHVNHKTQFVNNLHIHAKTTFVKILLA